MTKKLLHKTLRSYLVWSVLILAIAAPLFYFATKKLYLREADETLVLHKNEFLKYTAPALQPEQIHMWNRLNQNIRIDSASVIVKDTVFFTSYNDMLDVETEPYRELKTPVQIQGRPYTLTLRTNLVQIQYMVKSVALLFLAIIAILLTGLFFITRRLSKKIWQPFYHSLQQVESFEIDKNTVPDLPQTGIEEFNRLNTSVQKLIERNIIIYNNQREFVENAAHELQTPLAVFKAKIDTLVQHPDIKKEQLVMLDALNDNVARLTRLNKNLLLLSKIDHHAYGGQQRVSLNALIQKNLEFFTEQAKAKNITIQAKLQQQINIEANPELAEMLISNFFLNTISHNIPGGRIVIETTGNTLKFSNTGQASALDTDKLFNRFFKADPSGQGTGLGLSIVKKIAGLYKWQVRYEYSEGMHRFSVGF